MRANLARSNNIETEFPSRSSDAGVYDSLLAAPMELDKRQPRRSTPADVTTDATTTTRKHIPHSHCVAMYCAAAMRAKILADKFLADQSLAEKPLADRLAVASMAIYPTRRVCH